MNTASDLKIENEDSFKLSDRKEEHKSKRDSTSYVEEASRLSKS